MPFKSLLYVTDCPHTYINAFPKAFVTEKQKKFLYGSLAAKKENRRHYCAGGFFSFSERCVHRRGVCESVCAEASGGMIDAKRGGTMKFFMSVFPWYDYIIYYHG